MCGSVWKSPVLSNSSRATHVAGCKSCVVTVRAEGGESEMPAFEGVCPGMLCRMCCSSPQLCLCPQVSSCLSACYDVLAALARCLSPRRSPLLFPLVPPPVPLDVCWARGWFPLAPLPPHTHSPAPVLDPSLSHWALLLGSGLP